MQAEAARRRRLAQVLWLVAAAVIWNVSFDRQLSLAAARFAQQNVTAWQAGQRVSTIDAGYRPEIPRAAGWASLAAGSVLAAGAAVTVLTTPRRGRVREARPAAR